MALVAVVLVIACVNVANLLLARATTRSHEIALRLAIGAGRSRILRQLLTESAMLATAGTIVGIALGVAGSRGLAALIATGMGGPDSSDVLLEVALNWRVAAAASSIMVATTLLLGLAPAYRASLTSPRAISIKASRAAEPQARLATVLIVAQVALSLALVSSAGLFARTLYNLRALDRGFRTDNVLLVSFDPRRAHLSSMGLQEFNRSVLRSVERLPGIQRVTLAAVTPLQGGGMSRPVFVNAVSTGEEEVYFNVVAPRYFEIMDTPLLAGRDFTSADDAIGPPVAVVNEAFVRRYLQRGSTLGQRVSFLGADGGMQIVSSALPHQIP